MSPQTAFIVGSILGAIVGCNLAVLVLALCRAAASADREKGGSA